jgi:probable addiction module antidote protein
MGKAKITFSRFDTADYLKSKEDIAAYLQAVAEENDPALLTHALGVVARARNMTKLSSETGITRQGLYKALSGEGDPSFGNVMKIAHALGYQIMFHPVELDVPSKAKKKNSSKLSEVHGAHELGSRASTKRNRSVSTAR